ncbi:MAG TPA: protein kinase [Kineosporiaceae bacterium]|nr:protein kinase [Kineosporiaceae bacterium]
MPDVTDLRPGDPESIAGYRVLSRLGSGGQGVVFLAAASSGDLVAIKRLLNGPEDTQARAQFAKEVAAARLVAPFCTAQVVDAQLEGDSPYVVSEFIPGPSLQQQIQRSGPMQGTTLQRMAIGTATALAAIHQAGVVHRDFKPANVMISPEGPRVIDFGIARDLATETTVTSRVFGTPAYMSPEQLRADVVGPATDMFAWASVIVYAATGRAPFDAEHMMAVMYRITSGEPNLSGVPDALVGVLRQCLEKDPARRPTAQQALAQLLGRPGSQPDQTDPTTVLAEATGLVRGAATVLDRGAAGAPTVLRPAYDQPPPFEQASSAQPPEPPTWGTPAPSTSQTPGLPILGTPGLSTSGTPGTPIWGTPPAEAPEPEPADLGTRAGQAWSADAGHLASLPRRHRRRSVLQTAVVLAIILGGAAAFNGNFPGWSTNRDSGVPAGDQEAYEAAVAAAASAAAESAAAESADAPATAKATDAEVVGADGDGGTIVLGNAGGIPARFAGSWKGRIVESTGDHATVRLTLKAGAPSGRLKFAEFGCSGTVKMTSAVVNVLTLEAVITKDPKRQCAQSSKVTVIELSGGELQFAIVDDGEPSRAGSGTLHS